MHSWFGVELAESIFSSDDTGTFTPCKLRFVMHGGATKRPARFHIPLNPPYVWICKGKKDPIPPTRGGGGKMTNAAG